MGWGGVRGGTDSECGDVLLGHWKMPVPSLLPMPGGARFGEVEGRGDTFLERRPLSEESKFPGSWPSLLEFPRSFFFLKARDLDTTSLAGHEKILVIGGVSKSLLQTGFCTHTHTHTHTHTPRARLSYLSQSRTEALHMFDWIPKKKLS